MKSREKLKEQETMRSVVYLCLAETFRRPGKELGHVCERLEAALGGLGSHALEKSTRLMPGYGDHSAPCSLAVEYARLFIGPFGVVAPPYGSVYLEGKRRLMGESTMDVRRHYQLLGLDLSADFKAAPDHICAELEFMHVLVRQGVDAIDAAEHNLLSVSVRHQWVFLEQHLALWIPAFTAQVIDHARTGYYRDLAEVTRRFIAEEWALLADLTTVPSEMAHAAK